MKKFVLGLLLVPAVAQANYSCTGKVTYLGVDDRLNVNNGYGIHSICSLKDQENIEKCKAWMSLVMMAKASDREIRMFYRDITGKGSTEETCQAVGNWVTPEDTMYHLTIF